MNKFYKQNNAVIFERDTSREIMTGTIIFLEGALGTGTASISNGTQTMQLGDILKLEDAAGVVYANRNAVLEVVSSFNKGGGGGGQTVTDVYVSRSTKTPKLHDIARYKQGLQVLWDRWDGTKWEQIGAYGNSIHTDRFVTEAYSNKLTGFHHKADGVEERVLGPAVTKDNTLVVGRGQDDLVFAGTNMLHLKVSETVDEVTLQPQFDEQLTTQLLEFKSTQLASSKVSHLAIRVISTSADPVPFRIVYYKAATRLSKDVVWNSGTRATYMSTTPDLSMPTSNGTVEHWVKLPIPYWSDVGNVVYVSAHTAKPITYLGHTYPSGDGGANEFVLWMKCRKRSYIKQDATLPTTKTVNSNQTIEQKQELILGTLASNITLSIATGVDTFSVSDRAGHLATRSVLIELNATTSLTMNTAYDNCKFNLIGGVWSYYNIRNGKGGTI